MQCNIHDDLRRIVSETMLLTVGAPVEECATSVLAGSNHAVGTVHIVGGWNGTLTLALSGELGPILARRIFDGGDGVPEEGEAVLELVRELTNIVGGNVKSILGERCVLSTPKTKFADPCRCMPPESADIMRLHFRCLEGVLQVVLAESLVDLSPLPRPA